MNRDVAPAVGSPSLVHGRLCILLAAILWSLNGFFSKVLTRPTPLELHEPSVAPLQMAFFRVLFAGLFLLPTLRRADISFRPSMLGMVLCFAVMNGLFLSAIVLGTAANASLLQYTAPLWMYLAGLWLPLGTSDRRGRVALAGGMIGIAIIFLGSGGEDNWQVLLLGVGSGITYAGVLIFLRFLRSLSSNWLTIWNHLGAAPLLAVGSYLGVVLLLIPSRMWSSDLPTWPQLGVLFVFGSLQMGFPYYLMSRGLRTVNASEASTITLIEPALTGLWAYLISPDTETPAVVTFVGGALILGSLAWRYWPRRAK
jgi:drug/metabolite transporter (DMT)-like permease